MSESLVNIASRVCHGADTWAKPVKTYAIYDRYFGGFSESITLLELGVHEGRSLKVWANYFPKGKILGIDADSNGSDFSEYPNIVFERADQTDSNRLKEICATYAPNGLDIVVDDASHIGQNSATSYATLFPLLNSGGLYIVEDWGTGYFNDWADGSYPDSIEPQITGTRILSHDFGMVGFVKSLIDQVAGDNVKAALREPPTRADTISFAHFYKQAVVLLKA